MRRLVSALLFFCLLLAALPGTAQVYVDQTPPEGWDQGALLRLTVFRTGEGDCMLLEADGECMMIDGGPYKYREKLRDAMAERQITRMKYLFSTHPHDDHIEGLRMLMSYGMDVEEFVSVFPKTFRNDYQKKAVQQAEKSGVPYRQLSDGETLFLGDAALTIHYWEAGKTINAKSAMARLEYGDCSALLCADIVGETQHYFLENLPAEELKADIVKAPHHGLTPFVTEFLTAVDPAFIWITNYSTATSQMNGQAKYRSLPYKHSGDGTIIIECDGTDWYIRQTLKQF